MCLFYLHTSQGTIITLAALTQLDVVEMVEAAALLSPITYLEHISAPLVLRMVGVHLDQVVLCYPLSLWKCFMVMKMIVNSFQQMVFAMGLRELNFRRFCYASNHFFISFFYEQVKILLFSFINFTLFF